MILITMILITMILIIIVHAKYGGTTVPTQQTMDAMQCFIVKYGASSPMTTITTTFDDIIKYGDIHRMCILAINNNNNVKYYGPMMYATCVTPMFYMFYFPVCVTP